MIFRRLFRAKVAQPEGLLKVLTDRSARLDERDDAAMDLGAYDEALQTLIAVATTAGEEEMIVDSCGESINDIWKRTGGFDRAIYLSLPAAAQKMISPDSDAN